MPGMKWAHAFPLVVVLAACGAPKPEAPAAGSTASDTSVDDSSSKVPRRGILTASGGVMTFRECGAPASAATTLTDARGELAKALAALSARPAEGIYVELDGVTVLRARTVHGSACDAPVFDGEFVASGNEPFWAVEIRENGITFRSPEIPKGRKYPYSFTRTETGSVLYATKLEGPIVSTLEVALEPATCVDSMSGELRSFKAHVTRDGQKLEGCAAAGVPRGEFGRATLDELNRFAGSYPHIAHLWNDPVLEKRLSSLLGATLPTFLENMKVQSPVMKDGGVFYVTGNKPHQGGADAAVFLADPATDTVEAIVFEKGSRRDFKEGGRDVALPPEVVTIIGNLETR